MLNRQTDRRLTPWFRVLIVLPSFGERESVAKFVPELDKAVQQFKQRYPHKVEFTALYVEDADRDVADKHRTDLGINDLLRGYRLHGLNDVRYYWRRDDWVWGDLAGAVVDGLRIGRKFDYNYAIVMNGNGQHPASLIDPIMRCLLGSAEAKSVDFVMPSRYAAEDDSSALGSSHRRQASMRGRRPAKLFFPRLLAHMSDPLGGCFAVNLGKLNVEVLGSTHDRGVALEAAVLNQGLSYGEFGYALQQRISGESKTKLSHGAGLFRQLIRLRWRTWPEWVRFGIIGGGTSVAGALLLAAMFHAGTPLRAAVWTELVVTLLVNFWFYHRDLWPGLTRKQLMLRMPPFLAVRFGMMWVSAHIAVELVAGGFHYQIANAIGLLAGVAVNWPTTRLLFNFRRAELVPGPDWNDVYDVISANSSAQLWVMRKDGQIGR